MSGVRLYSFREGDRSEYLANYLLSGLGLVTPVPRQEDIGFDFYCQLADQEKGSLTFGYPFIVQVKSENTHSIFFGNTKIEDWKKEDIEWLFRLEIPIFFAFIDKSAMKMLIYNCSPLAFDYYVEKTPSVLEFKRRIPVADTEANKPILEGLPNWTQLDKGDGNKHIIDLGNPLITITNEDIFDEAILKKKKSILRNVVLLKQQNIIYKKLNLPYINWVLKSNTNESIITAWAHFISGDTNILNILFNSLSHGFISLAMNLKQQNEIDLLNSLKPFLKKIPVDQIPQLIKTNYPEFFE